MWLRRNGVLRGSHPNDDRSFGNPYRRGNGMACDQRLVREESRFAGVAKPDPGKGMARPSAEDGRRRACTERDQREPIIY